MTVHHMSLHTRRCELQLSRAERAPGSWTCASATLKLGRCTKGSLEPGTAYLFRARAIGRDEVGPWGSCVEMQTSLPQIPQVAVVLTPVELRHDQHSMYRGACRSILKHKLASPQPHLANVRAQECSAALKVPAAAVAQKNAEAAKRAGDEMLAARKEKERLQMLERTSRERVARVVAQVRRAARMSPSGPR